MADYILGEDVSVFLIPITIIIIIVKIAICIVCRIVDFNDLSNNFSQQYESTLVNKVPTTRLLITHKVIKQSNILLRILINKTHHHSFMSIGKRLQ